MTEAADLQEVFHHLRDVSAPPTLAPDVLTRCGLADSYFRLDTPTGVAPAPVGPVFVAYNAQGVSAVMRHDTPEEFERAFIEYLGRPAYPVEHPPEELVRAITDHLRGYRSGSGAGRSGSGAGRSGSGAGRSGSGAGRGGSGAGRRGSTVKRRPVRFDLRGLSEFEQAVLRKALDIPHGETRPYAWVAREIGRPRAVRAVGNALAANPIPLLIPCHRVVRSTGEIGNYGLGGPETKRALLEWEGANLAEVEAFARTGIQFIGSATTRAYCLPTCRHARRIDSRHRRPFQSAGEAAAAGFRPCKVCRPAPQDISWSA